MIKSGLAHNLHHNVHWEWCFDYDERVEYIKKHKPMAEQPLRLKQFFLVPEDKIPGKDSTEWAAYTKARAAYIARYAAELDALCKELCPDCTWNGRSIFEED
mgnify:CR=1 FL=1